MLIVVEKVLRSREVRRIISIKKINDDELRVIKKEPSRKEIDDELEVIKKKSSKKTNLFDSETLNCLVCR